MDKTIGQRIKTRRKECKLTGIQIKEQTGISTGNLSDIENGNVLPSAIALMELSKILECSTDYILFGKSRRNENKEYLNISEEDKKLLEFFHGISEDDKEELLMLAQMKYNKSKRKNNTKEISSTLIPKNETSEIA